MRESVLGANAPPRMHFLHIQQSHLCTAAKDRCLMLYRAILLSENVAFSYYVNPVKYFIKRLTIVLDYHSDILMSKMCDSCGYFE